MPVTISYVYGSISLWLLVYCKSRIFRVHFISQISWRRENNGLKYSKSHAILAYYLVQKAKTPKLRTTK